MSRVVITAISTSFVGTCNAIALALTGRQSQSNVLTVTMIDFDAMIFDDSFDEWFRSNLRCSQNTFHRLCQILRDELHDLNTDEFIKSHSFEKKVAIMMYFLASEGGYRDVANAFGVSKSWAIETTAILIQALRKMITKVVYFPKSKKEWNVVEEEFYKKQKFPGVVGAIDGSLIQIDRPKIFEGYYCRKGYPALNVQAIVDAKKKFMSFEIRPGSWSDKKIWSGSYAKKNIRNIIPAGCHLIGDAGYTLSPFLLTPYIDENLTKRQKRYNYLLSSTRMSVECAFGLWKGRFRILTTRMNEKTVAKTCDVICATIVLHNLLISLYDDTVVIHDDESDSASIQMDGPEETQTQLGKIARLKRKYISALITS